MRYMGNLNTPYVIITTARNEEAYIEKTIQSVIAQTVLPKKWVIVSDGSTDRTDEIVKQYETNHDFIQLLRKESDMDRNFGSKVYAIRAGVEQLNANAIEYDFIGNLDADVSLEPDYYERTLAKFDENCKLGIAGGIVIVHDSYKGKIYKQRFYNTGSVSGAIQTFRRQCFEDIGGYTPLKTGGVDTVAEVTARMHGWQTRTFLEIVVLHHRQAGTEGSNILAAMFRQGYRDAMFGNHPIYHMANCAYRMFERPYCVGGILRMCGYVWASLKREKRDVSDDFVKYIRCEQMHKLGSLLSSNKTHRGGNRNR